MTTLFNLNLKKKTGVIYYTNKNIIRKFSIDSQKRKLINELNGFNWYLGEYRRKIKKIKFKSKHNQKHNYIDYPLIKATKIPFWKTLSENREYIQILLDHYLKVWPKKNLIAYHGDLTIGNVLFDNNYSPIVIDWEFFKKRECWGLDICHLLISSIVLPTLAKNKTYIPSSELQLFKEIWKNFFYGKKLIYLEDPIQYLKKLNKKISKPKKNDFIFKITKQQKKQILEIINNND